jgi:pSer/pThr/pTyr-binding forkhead associated (FHA) protein
MRQLTVQAFLTALSKVEGEERLRELCPFPALLELPTEGLEGERPEGFEARLDELLPFLRELSLHFLAPSAPAQPVSIGTSRSCEVQLQNRSVSRRHALALRRGASWSLKDLESLNGSYVEGRRLPAGIPLPIPPGGLVRLGDWRALFLNPSELLELLAACRGERSKQPNRLGLLERAAGHSGLSLEAFLHQDLDWAGCLAVLLESPVATPSAEISPEERTREVSPEEILGMKRGGGDIDLRVHPISEHGVRGVLIGRGQHCEVRILEGSVSKEHARLRLKGEAWLVMDLESSNGTHVADRRLPAGVWTLVPAGSTVSIGAYRAVLLSPKQATALIANLRRLSEQGAKT